MQNSGNPEVPCGSLMERIAMKTNEELNALKEEFEALNKKLVELTEEELTRLKGGTYICPAIDCEHCRATYCPHRM